MPTLRGTSTASPAGPGPATIALPSGTLPTDVVAIMTNVDSGPAATFTAPGMTTVATERNLGTNPIQIGVLAGTGLTGSVTVTCSDPSMWIHAAAFAWIDADPTLIAGALTTGDGTAGLTVPAVTSTVDDAAIMVLVAQNYGVAPTLTPTLPQIVMFGTAVWVYDGGVLPSAGSSGTVEVSGMVTNRSALAAQFAIQPPAVPPSGVTIRTAAGVVRGPGGGVVRR